MLFNRKGNVIIGEPGCSKYFMLGLLEIADPSRLDADVEELRARLLADPYLQDVPSLKPEAGRTAVAFHATDDPPEVRREVYRLLLRHEIRAFAVVRNKHAVLRYVRERNQHDSAYRYHPNELYDHLVRRLFRDRLHTSSSYEVWFARRGKSDRTAALRQALEAARERFTQRFGISREVVLDVFAGQPKKSSGLQAVDYLLWALQRFYERQEVRYLRYSWPLFRLVHDVDDTGRNEYGEYYTKKRPPWRAAEEAPGI